MAERKAAAKKPSGAGAADAAKEAKSAKAKAKGAPAAKKDAKAPVKKAAKKDAKPAKKEKATLPKGKVLDDVRLYDVIARPVITEKTTMASEQNKVVFLVRPDADKQSIKKAVEGLFGVNVTKVNTVNIQGKSKRFRGRPGKRSDVRKAVVTLKAGQSIDIAAGVK